MNTQTSGQSAPVDRPCSAVHPRVIELMRERLGEDACRDRTDQQIIELTEGTFFRLGCLILHIREQLIDSFVSDIRRIKCRVKR